MCPPGGMVTREVGRSVITLNELVLLADANALLDTASVDLVVVVVMDSSHLVAAPELSEETSS